MVRSRLALALAILPALGFASAMAADTVGTGAGGGGDGSGCTATIIDDKYYAFLVEVKTDDGQIEFFQQGDPRICDPNGGDGSTGSTGSGAGSGSGTITKSPVASADPSGSGLGTIPGKYYLLKGMAHAGGLIYVDKTTGLKIAPSAAASLPAANVLTIDDRDTDYGDCGAGEEATAGPPEDGGGDRCAEYLGEVAAPGSGGASSGSAPGRGSTSAGAAPGSSPVTTLAQANQNLKLANKALAAAKSALGRARISLSRASTPAARAKALAKVASARAAEKRAAAVVNEDKLIAKSFADQR
jgi:hypothetical protein